MAQRGHLKLVDRYQFNEKKFTTVEGVDEFQAVHVDSKQSYTLKRVSLANQTEREQSTNIINELTLLKKLNHPFIPKCHKLLKTTNNMYLIFDRLAGTTLARFISNDLPAITWENQLKSCLRIAEELCSVLGYLADRKISHSFINFDHVLIDKEGLSKVIHFSCAEELKGDEKSIEELHKNRTNDICNAPQITQETVSIKTDVYSVGIILEKLFATLQGLNKRQKAQERIADKSIGNILTFCKKMTAEESTSRVSSKEAEKFFVNKLYQEVEVEEDSRSHLIMTDPGIRVQLMDDDRRMQRFHSPNSTGLRLKKTQLSEVGSQTQEYLYIARKVLHKRNLSELLLQLSRFCSSSPAASGERCNPLGFLLVKKSTLIISQLAKFLETGRGEGMRMQEKTRQKLAKHRLFVNLEKSIHKEMKHLQEKLVASAQLLKEILKSTDGNKKLMRELEVEAVDNDYLRKCVADFQEEVMVWREIEEEKSSEVKITRILEKKQLALLFFLSLLTDFHTIEQVYDQLFSQSGCCLWTQSFFTSLLKMEEADIESLILAQGKITYSRQNNTPSLSCRSISTSRRI